MPYVVKMSRKCQVPFRGGPHLCVIKLDVFMDGFCKSPEVLLLKFDFLGAHFQMVCAEIKKFHYNKYTL